jgi:hypothetical protein
MSHPYFIDNSVSSRPIYVRFVAIDAATFLPYVHWSDYFKPDSNPLINRRVIANDILGAFWGSPNLNISATVRREETGLAYSESATPIPHRVSVDTFAISRTVWPPPLGSTHA